jgi:hypothetical protein
MSSSNTIVCRSTKTTGLGQRFQLLFSEPSNAGTATWSFQIDMDLTYGAQYTLDSVNTVTLSRGGAPGGQTITLSNVSQGPHTLVLYTTQNTAYSYDGFQRVWKYSRNGATAKEVTATNLATQCSSGGL